jgi:hypothetical protein
VDGSEGSGAVAGVGLEGDAVAGVDVRKCVEVAHGAVAGRGWRRWDISVQREDHRELVDVGGVLQLNQHVVLPAIVDGGWGDTGGAELGGQCDTRAIEGKQIVREGDAVNRHDRDQKNAGEGKLELDSVLIVADEARQSDYQQSKQIALGEAVGGGGANENENVRDGERNGQGQKLIP